MNAHPSILVVGSLALLATLAAAPRAQLVFQPPVGTAGGSWANRLAVGDVDEDGRSDLVVSHFAFGDPPAVLLAQADGSFGPPQLIPGLTASHTVSNLADFDEDGHLDLLTFGGAPPAAVHLGDGQGGFGTPVAVYPPTFSWVLGADVGDFDADGNLDIVMQSGQISIAILGAVSARRGNGDGTFGPAVVIEVIGFDDLVIGSDQLRVGDMNGDGWDDIVFEGLLPTRLSLGDGTFDPACPSQCVTFGGNDLELVDVDGDGRDDAVTPSGVYLALPDGSLAPPLPLATQFFHHKVATGDFDGDGELDVMVGRNEAGSIFAPGSTFGDVIVLRGHGDGTFEESGVVISHVPEPADIAALDVDLDGRLDAVVANLVERDPTVRTLLNSTYPAGSPFTDLGGALAGSNGYPIQLASGTLVAGQPFSFKLANGPPNGAAFHIVGLAALNAPFKLGTLIPFPHLVNGPLPLNASGFINLAANWPAGGSGLTLWVQFWMPNGGGPAGFVASSGVRAQIP